jgi:RNA polymerase sigma-70 factor, ECF subfamily
MSAQPSATAASIHSLLSFRAIREGARDTEMNASELPSNELHPDAVRNRELAALLGSAATGHAQAFERFYERSIHFASAVARRIVGLNHLEDVLAETYLQAWRDAHRFDAERGNAIGWIVTIARSRALDRLRQENVRHAGMTGAPDAASLDLEDEETPGPDTLLERAQTAHSLYAALRELSSNERWCIALAYYRDFSHSEVATITGLPLGTVKSLIKRAQQKLRDLMIGGKPLAASKL